MGGFSQTCLLFCAQRMLRRSGLISARLARTQTPIDSFSAKRTKREHIISLMSCRRTCVAVSCPPHSQRASRAHSASRRGSRAFVGPCCRSALARLTGICRKADWRLAHCTRSAAGGKWARSTVRQAALFTAGITARTRGPGPVVCRTPEPLRAPPSAQAGLLPERVIYVDAGDEQSVLACF